MPRKTNEDQQRQIVLRFMGSDDSSKEVPMGQLVDYLTRVLQLIKAVNEHHLTRSSEWSTADRKHLRSISSPRCLPPQPGSYEIPVNLGESVSNIPDQTYRHEVMQQRKLFHQVIASIHMDDDSALPRLIPDNRCRNSVHRLIDSLRPKQQQELQLQILDLNRSLLYDTHRTLSRSHRTKTELSSDDEVNRYCGVINTITPNHLKIDLLQGCKLKVPYDVLATPRLPIRIGAMVEVEGHTKQHSASDTLLSLRTVKELRIVDEIAITRSGLYADGRWLVASPPLRFRVEHFRHDGVYELTGDFGVRFAVTRPSDLSSCLDEMLEMMWGVYAEEQAGRLDPSAEGLGREMRKRIRG